MIVIDFNNTFVSVPEYIYRNVLRISPNFNDVIITNLILLDSKSIKNKILSIDLIYMLS
jgi:hypothetical protein